MWIFTILPEFIIHVIFFIGLLGIIFGFILNFIPFIRQYLLPIKIISLLIFSFGIFLEGGLLDYKSWELKAAELKVKLAEIENKAKENDIKIVEKVVNKKQIIREKGKDLIHYVDREVIKYDEKFSSGKECELPTDFYKLYNESLGKQ